MLVRLIEDVSDEFEVLAEETIEVSLYGVIIVNYCRDEVVLEIWGYEYLKIPGFIYPPDNYVLKMKLLCPGIGDRDVISKEYMFPKGIEFCGLKYKVSGKEQSVDVTFVYEESE